ncbi:MAG: hypothetical protein SWX82_15410 [Cyanobacteriota bacterium]|nr:hypothetical protein [Cyanobacteriota bacterium]
MLGNSYYWTIVITLLIRDRCVGQFLLLDNSYCSAEERHSEQVRQLNRCVGQFLLLDNSYCSADSRSLCWAILTIGQ